MRPYAMTSEQSGSTSNARRSLGRLGKIALATSILFFVLGGLSSAWAGEKDHVTTRSPYLHLTGVSIHVDLGLLHLGGHHRHYRPARQHHYRHGPHNYRHRPHYAGHRHFNRHDKHFGSRQYRGHNGPRGHQGNHAVSQSNRRHRR